MIWFDVVINGDEYGVVVVYETYEVGSCCDWHALNEIGGELKG